MPGLIDMGVTGLLMGELRYGRASYGIDMSVTVLLMGEFLYWYCRLYH